MTPFIAPGPRARRLVASGFAFSVAVATLCASATARAEAPPARDTKEAPPAESSSVYTDGGLLGPLRFGPTIGVGAPDGGRVSFAFKYAGVLALGASGAYLPETEIPTTGASVKRVGGEAFARVHPFRGAFFLEFAAGYAQTKGAVTEETEAFNKATSVSGHAYAATTYLAPKLGYQWMLPLGITAGFDIGVEIPVHSRGPTYDVSKYGLVQPVEASGPVATAMRYVATGVVPVVHLLDLGFML
ncbi:hypothetical protein AKJ09_07830 [Labilithrix luteola]|uniref:Outer membrane protein beta-barrel domain-containing protein n=1 Tax=Labilithrix luteola TaxID=1391654 RepID=A0A0K1Q668_9BACT|nr:hypothetical protein [Labilithrix luteola]AKV01167.1 hypothetical protein AKJ09_07830 [Labilithrix luteola]